MEAYEIALSSPGTFSESPPDSWLSLHENSLFCAHYDEYLNDYVLRDP